MKRIETRLNENEDLKASMLRNDNTDDNKRYKFGKVLEVSILDCLLNTRLELYKKLTDVRVKEEIKRKWYEGYKRGLNARNETLRPT
jgi:hypothetical protein